MTDSSEVTLSRIASAAIGVGMLVASVFFVWQGVPQQFASSLPGDTPAQEPLAVQASPPDQRVVCPGPVLTYVAQETTPRGFSEPEPDVLGSEYVSVELGTDEFLREFAGEDAKTAPAPTYLEQPAAAGFLNATSASEINSVFAWGLVAQSCHAPVSEGWLVGGSTTTGRQGVVSLANPGSVPATVDLELYGSSGEISAPGARGILIQPGERRVFSLAGLAPGESAPVIRMVSAGTPVSMTLHTSLIRGLDPDGMDLVGVQDAPSAARYLPGLYVDSEAALERVSALEGYDDVGPVLRLLAPGEDADVVVTIVRPGRGDVVTEVSLDAGRVFDVALDELGEGHAGVVIDSSTPVVAGIRHTSIGDPRTDLAWVSSAPTLEDVGSVVIPGGVDATVHVLSQSDESATVRFARVSADGADVLGSGTIEVDSHAVEIRGLGGAGGNYLFETDQPVSIAVVLREAGQLANLVATPPPPELPTVDIYAR